MKLIREDLDPVTEAQIRQQLGLKTGGDNTFMILEADDASYVQMIGGGVACLLEWRDQDNKRHYRAYVEPKKVPWSEASTIGGVQVRPEETLDIDDAVEAFCAFLNGRDFPSYLKWRDITEGLAEAGIAPP